MRRPAGIVSRSFGAATASPSPHGRAPVAPAVATNSPTSAYRQHHDVAAPLVDATAFRQGWRVSSLLEAGRIDREAWDAAHAWRRWAETVTPFGWQSWDVRVDVSAAPNDSGILIRTTAATRLRETAAALGPLRIRILEAVLVKDMSWTVLGRLLRLSDKAARDWAVEALEALTDYCSGRTVAPPPVLPDRAWPAVIYLRNVHPRKAVLVPLGAGWTRVLRPAVTAELPERVLHTNAVRELLLRRMVEIADGAAWDADTRQTQANRTDWARRIAMTERAEFAKLMAGLAPQRGHYWPAEQLEGLRKRLAAGATIKQLAAEHGRTRQSMSDLCHRRGLLRRH